ncbi:MAG: hypothetical protein U0074_05330 [Kouleothrix sp.]
MSPFILNIAQAVGKSVAGNGDTQIGRLEHLRLGTKAKGSSVPGEFGAGGQRKQS